MRMDPTCGQTARELIAACSVNELRTILQRYGQEPLAGRYAAAIKRAADQGALRSAEGLATVIEKAAGPGRIARARKHVATRVFMALRMAVNEEIVELDRLLRAAPRLLKVHGRLAVISFHSGEDRRVKTAFTDLARPDRRIPASVPLANFELPSPRFRQVTRKPVRPSAEEAHANPRSRSAKLRVLEKISSDVANAQE
jgi:16S rRNA (cytosine1402-N4)-methyltransferase